jgi:hypothetical protein
LSSADVISAMGMVATAVVATEAVAATVCTRAVAAVTAGTSGLGGIIAIATIAAIDGRRRTGATRRSVVQGQRIVLPPNETRAT